MSCASNVEIVEPGRYEVWALCPACQHEGKHWVLRSLRRCQSCEHCWEQLNS